MGMRKIIFHFILLYTMSVFSTCIYLIIKSDILAQKLLSFFFLFGLPYTGNKAKEE